MYFKSIKYKKTKIQGCPKISKRPRLGAYALKMPVDGTHTVQIN